MVGFPVLAYYCLGLGNIKSFLLGGNIIHPMNQKAKGTNAERELVHRFWGKGWPCVRVAGSGCSRYPSPDLLAGNRERMVAIECKATKENSKYFPKEEIRLLRELFRNQFQRFLDLDFFAKLPLP